MELIKGHVNVQKCQRPEAQALDEDYLRHRVSKVPRGLRVTIPIDGWQPQD